ncbi:MHYT domain-containing protein [Donghicola eburneus]|uniref:Carbon monoxide dehydrogenase n=1 Tax=Donghicola eburneus TaxID=393278 RepID=A0A1M4MVG4_9RHOB|nr:MHYT domain-containing protein [Donghicola eburneus]SCM66341.1 hypothetical protein KARMA_0515 [Donghicola eburneus]
MTFIDYGHNLWLVAISFVVALVAGATGLWLTKDLSKKTVLQRKLSVALAAIALGGGIWSMHFVAMLGLRMPMLFYYDAAITLVSALIAILIVTSALLLLHFRKRTKTTILIAGTLVGAGVLAMHYVGMAGMQLCQPVYTPSGVIGSSILAIGLCILAFAVAYGRRSNRNILIGTLCFGVAVTAVHFLAMSSTNFVALERTQEIGPLISKEVMAIGVILSSFVIFGMFLWVGSTVLVPVDPNSADPVATAPVDQPTETTPASPEIWVPCEREGAKVRVAAGEVAFVRADGHYTQIYTAEGRYYCAWPITEATKRLVPEGLMKVHRSYLVNPSKVVHFERKKDKGRVSFGPSNLPEVPVSRSHLKEAETAFS